jgi:predicted exporter
MSRYGAWIWFAIVMLAAGYLLLRLASGITLQSNILALLPPTERDATAQKVQDRIAKAFSKRIVFLVGHHNPVTAHDAALRLTAALEQSGLVATITSRIDSNAQARIAAAYYPYRNGLLTSGDRERLLAHDGQALVTRASSLLYGPAGFANAKMIAKDPFLLLPNYFLGLPLPQSRLSSANGVLSVQDRGETYVLVSADLAGDPYATRFQGQFADFLTPVLAKLQTHAPQLEVLRTGAVFFAHDAADEAMGEASLMGTISLVATLAMILLVFRGLRPILLGFVAIGTGVVCAFVGALLIFGEVHTIALLFGVSLIAISVDYSLQYFCEYFDPGATEPATRLQRVLAGIGIGLFTTLIGYFTLLLAPFPGLRQVAAFSLIGLIASVLTVVLWYPLLDAHRPPEVGNRFVALAAKHWQLWESPDFRYARIAILTGCIALGLVGVFMLHADDDVRHLQSLSPDLRLQQTKIEHLTGSSPGTQFLLVRGVNEETVLQTEEKIARRLSALKTRGALGDFTAISQFVPSISRQKENRGLVDTRLIAPHLKSYLGQLGYQGTVDTSNPDRFLTPQALPRIGPLSLLGLLSVGDEGHAAHIVLLQNISDADAVRHATADMPQVRFVSLTDDWSRLFGDYRRYALGLLVLSALLMYPIHGWRYGWVNALRVMTPSILAVTLAAPLAALTGVSFTFFNAMALVLVLSIGVDYAIFCRETSGERKAVTVLAIALAALSTILSFGMLALSRVFAVHAFGMTMLIGITVAFLLAPLAGDADSNNRAVP